MKILLCEPTYFGIDYEINPWMHTENKVDSKLASDQWNRLRDTLDSLGVNLKYIAPQEGMPDMVFTANGGVVIENRAYVPTFSHPERQVEESHWEKWFNDNGYEVIKSNHKFEGAGDALWNGKKMFMGYGFRSSLLASNRAVYELLDKGSVVSGRLVNPRFYHLDTCFCPLDEKRSLMYVGAFDDDSIRRFSKHTKIIPISANEAANFACNAVVVEKAVIIPSECPETASLLKKEGYTPIMIPMSEFMKSGGACKCLTLRV